MLRILIGSLVLSLLINGLLFLVAYRLRSDKLTDASYALSFMTLAVFDLVSAGTTIAAVIVFCLVTVWALRIGSFLVYRVLRAGKDRRFDGIRENFFKFGQFWLGQGITAWILMLPAALLAARSLPWKAWGYTGVAVWIIGFLAESIADAQKYRFKQQANPPHPWIDTGLWHYSRHPNYFGEILVWIGIYLTAAAALPMPALVVAAISPPAICLLLLFVSGIPPLEKSADKRWGHDPNYQQYKRRTSLLVPRPLKAAKKS